MTDTTGKPPEGMSTFDRAFPYVVLASPAKQSWTLNINVARRAERREIWEWNERKQKVGR